MENKLNKTISKTFVKFLEKIPILKRFPLLTVFSCAFLCSSFGTVIYYIVSVSEGFLHSDCTDSMYWANATIENGKLIADNFRYAAILPFSGNLWMIPLIKMYGVTMKTQIISMVIFACLYVASQIWLFRSLRFSWAMNFTATGVMLMLLSSSVKMREIMWEHIIYYSLAILLFNCLLSLALGIIHSLEKFRETEKTFYGVYFLISVAFIAVLSAGTALNGF